MKKVFLKRFVAISLITFSFLLIGCSSNTEETAGATISSGQNQGFNVGDGNGNQNGQNIENGNDGETLPAATMAPAEWQQDKMGGLPAPNAEILSSLYNPDESSVVACLNFSIDDVRGYIEEIKNAGFEGIGDIDFEAKEWQVTGKRDDRTLDFYYFKANGGATIVYYVTK